MGFHSLDNFLRKKGVVGDKKNDQKTKTEVKPTPKPTPKKTPNPVKPAAKQIPKTHKAKPRPAPRKARPTNQNQKSDPFFARPTVAKRENFHPTKFLNSNFQGEIRVVPLGGMEQVGSNMMFIETSKDIVIIDTGLNFPSPEHLGIDVLVPDVSYLVKNKAKIRGVIYTHGHLDHIGGIPFILPQLGFPPLFMTRLTKELVLANCEEHKINSRLKITEITPKSKIKLGIFDFEFFHINHSIPDGVGIVCKTPLGAIVHSSDFKFDYKPADDQPIDLSRIAQIGKSGVLMAMVDSTSASKSGHTLSESVIEDHLKKIVSAATGRLVLATFASNIGRISKVIELAEKLGRTVFLSGRSMEKNMAIARKLNYLRCKDGSLERMSNKADKMPPHKVLILSTGSQGEELAALTRMAAGTHKNIKLRKSDTVVFSSSPIPGNEMAIVSVRNNLAEIGVKAINNKELDIHVSGHAHAEECKLMTTLLNPKYFVPIHGEVFMREDHRKMVVKDLQIKDENTFLMRNGRGIVFSKKGARLMLPKESLAGPNVLIELGEKIGEHVLSDRTKMADAGIIIVNINHQKGSIKKIELSTRGFLYGDQNHEFLKKIEKNVKDVWNRNYDPARPERALVSPIEAMIGTMCYKLMRKEPLVQVIV